MANTNSSTKIELTYSPELDTFFCNDAACGGSMEIERLGRRFLVLRCTCCGGAIDGRLVNWSAAQAARAAHLAEVEQAQALAAKWVAAVVELEQDIDALRGELVEVVEVQPRGFWQRVLGH